MNWRSLEISTADSKETIVHVHMTVVKRNRMAGEGVEIRLLKFTMTEFLEYYQSMIDYALENKEYKVYCAAHFLCGCSKKFIVDGKRISEDDNLDALCDDHWKQETLGIPARIIYVG